MLLKDILYRILSQNDGVYKVNSYFYFFDYEQVIISTRQPIQDFEFF
jgi:hypothetical protein